MGRPTYPFPPYGDAERELESYARPSVRSGHGVSAESPPKLTGTTIGIKGPSGSGKTHLIFHLMQTARSELPGAYELYVKAESSDLIDLYSRAIQFLGLRRLRELHTALLGRLAVHTFRGHEAGSGYRPLEISGPLADQLTLKPASIYSLLETRIISESALLSARSGVLKSARSDFDDFLHAYSYLQHHTLSARSYEWICGKSLHVDILQQLGVQRNITNAEMAFTGFMFLVAVLGEVGQPFFIFIDQIERLILDAEPSVRALNKGRLHTLAEAVYAAGGFLCLAGMTKAWEEFPEDFLERLSTPAFKMPSITVEQILDLITIYLHPSESDRKYQKESDIYPFENTAVYEINRMGRGNIRAILSICNRSFEAAEKTKQTITTKIVQDAAEHIKLGFNRAQVLMQLKLILKKLGQSCVQELTIGGGIRVDLAVPDGKNPRLLIDVSEPNFLEDEARAAIRYVGMAHAIRDLWPEAKILIIEAGYVSAEVQERLRPYLDAHILYNPDDFVAEFTTAAEILLENPATSPGPNKRNKIIEEQLRTILQSRKREQENINSNIGRLFENASTSFNLLMRIVYIAIPILILALGLYAIFEWQVSQRMQIESAYSIEASKAASERRAQALQRLEALTGNKEFKATLADFYRTAAYLNKSSTYSDQREKLKENLFDEYNNLNMAFASVIQCANARICDIDVVCRSIGSDIKNFVQTAQKAEISGESSLTSFLSDCGIKWR